MLATGCKGVECAWPKDRHLDLHPLQVWKSSGGFGNGPAMVLVDCYWDNYPAPPRTMELMVCAIHAFVADEYIDSMVREDIAVSNYLSKRAKVRLYAPPLKIVRGEKI